MEKEKGTLKAKFQQNREQTFRSLYKKVFPAVARFVAKKGGDLALAEDIFQDAMILYFEKVVSDQICEPHNPQAYILGISRNLFFQHCKKNKPSLGLESLGEFTVAPSEEATPLPDRHRLLDYLTTAGKKCMDLLQAFYYFRSPMKEIAKEFGYRSERSATVQKYKCLEKVRETVKQAHYAEVIA
ncbi:MAG: sigma-70 family RNA polymerase sigma factor [Saprospiraceae bacterium]|nr:sigma-70 family RNA polymerase sigma factor [Saprospiraceae bacterium]